jgi:hypothetical protein
LAALADLERGYAISVRARDGHSEAQIRKTVLHAVYREKIYAETLGMDAHSPTVRCWQRFADWL